MCALCQSVQITGTIGQLLQCYYPLPPVFHHVTKPNVWWNGDLNIPIMYNNLFQVPLGPELVPFQKIMLLSIDPKGGCQIFTVTLKENQT